MMGVIELSRDLRRFSDVDAKVTKLAEKLIKTEEDNIQEMKKFLS